MNKTLLAIDIGSTKVCAVIAEAGNQDEIKILGHGCTKAQGIKKGTITNIELISKSVKKAVSDAKRIAGSNPTSGIVSISNAYAKSITSTGIVNLPNKDISLKQIQRVVQAALYNANIPNEYDVVHVLPYNFRVDDQEFIDDPYGMNANRLEVDVNIIITQKSNIANLTKAVKSAGVEAESIVLSGYASSLAVMNEDEKELGVAVIDIGGQTGDLAIHSGNSIRYIDYLGVGSNHITNDLSMALHTPLHIAEELKITYGDLTGESDGSETVELPVIGDDHKKNQVHLSIVQQVIFARVEETLSLLAKSLEKSSLKDQVSAGLILTGGMTGLKGIRELAQTIFSDMAVRIGYPKAPDGLFEEIGSPAYATLVGLLRYGAGEHTPYEINFRQKMLHSKEEKHEDVTDIRLGSKNGSSLLHDEESEATQSQTILFDDPPLLQSKKESGIKKVINWFKQLF